MFGIGAQLREERLRRNLALDDIARQTRIASRYLQAIEAEDYERLPGLVFTRNFVRQYALELQLDPDPLVQRLPKLDESMVQLPDPPARPRRRSWHNRTSPALTSALWLLILGGGGAAAYYHFNGFPRLRIQLLPAAETTAQAASKTAPAIESRPEPPQQEISADQPAANDPLVEISATPAAAPLNRPVQVVVTAHEVAWVQVTADGKTAYTGTLHPNETRAVSADDQVRVLTGNAGALTISLNGRTLGPVGQVRSVRLTAEGPEFPPAKVAAPEADPL